MSSDSGLSWSPVNGSAAWVSFAESPALEDLLQQAKAIRVSRPATRVLDLLVTGSRDWTSPHIPGAVLGGLSATYGPIYVEHGAARGLDQICHQLAKRMGDQGWPAPRGVPADWGRYGKAAGGIRNQIMVDHGHDLCIGFPLNTSVGTYDCLTRAKLAGIPTYMVKQDYDQQNWILVEF